VNVADSSTAPLTVVSDTANVTVTAVTVPYLVVRGEDDMIYYRVYNLSSDSWENWNAVPNGATPASPATVVVSNTLYPAVQGEHGASIWFSSINLTDNSFSGWTLLSGATPSAPALTD
jgi:hypothetical protein